MFGLVTNHSETIGSYRLVGGKNAVANSWHVVVAYIMVALVADVVFAVVRFHENTEEWLHVEMVAVECDVLAFHRWINFYQSFLASDVGGAEGTDLVDHS